ncbi:uncharacterized protein LOC118480611 [Helianthus annuus]|uniref:uncharacterized protein LOC118480611 n=1 Tax=Helianthus annuus TaxID=4232 RepID=UPI0016530F0F|nr:uncharacterized protein LOC118480611 [Helianthus annuus]
MDGDRHSWRRRRWDGAAGWRRWWFSFGQVWSNHDQRVIRGFGLTIVNNSFGSRVGSTSVNLVSRFSHGSVPVRVLNGIRPNFSFYFKISFGFRFVFRFVSTRVRFDSCWFEFRFQIWPGFCRVDRSQRLVSSHTCSGQIRCSGDLGVSSSQTRTLFNTWIIGRLSNFVDDDDAMKRSSVDA